MFIFAFTIVVVILSYHTHLTRITIKIVKCEEVLHMGSTVIILLYRPICSYGCHHVPKFSVTFNSKNTSKQSPNYTGLVVVYWSEIHLWLYVTSNYELRKRKWMVENRDSRYSSRIFLHFPNRSINLILKSLFFPTRQMTIDEQCVHLGMRQALNSNSTLFRTSFISLFSSA